ncbi:hypothetical protein [Imhoffiella purpurea]|uniref:Uncharacterized protein n=1 Tax=Imhoffiella purpurea TaxID=1249627 RepID=W9VT63_9GAMM|nr:hypothetical protein [Imhoffiella purpurea]EXJ13575.1 hypothetical protein D779_3578 [Imhoffiella purpurea]
MPILEDDLEISWFEAGSGIFDGIIDDSSCFPPLDDREIQREWLAGFAGTWAELTSHPPASLIPDPRRDPVIDVLKRVLADRPELLEQLLAIGSKS